MPNVRAPRRSDIGSVRLCQQLYRIATWINKVMSSRGAVVCVLFATLAVWAQASAEGGARDQIYIGDILAPGQKWYNYDTTAQLVIDKVNPKNATFAGLYEITNEGSTAHFPFRGEFDPVGITIGWVVSYWNEYINYHSLGAWTGYARIEPDSRRASLSVSSHIAHQDNSNTTAGYGTFVLQPN